MKREDHWRRGLAVVIWRDADVVRSSDARALDSSGACCTRRLTWRKSFGGHQSGKQWQIGKHFREHLD